MNDNIIPITRPNGGVQPQASQKAESKFPTEVINLPSKGWFYPTDSILASGTLEVKTMTAREEDILTSKNLISKNIVLDKLLESVVIDKGIKLDEMLVCDRNATFFAIRRLAYGDEYDAVISCGRCGKENNVTIDLSKFDNRVFNFDAYTRGENSFTFELPISKKVLTFKLLSKKDENAIEQELKGLEKVSKEISREITTRLTHIITSVDGDSSKARIRKFVSDEMPARDSLKFRSHLREGLPEIDSSFDFCCSHCNMERREDTPMGVTFFWPNR